ncbi:MAG: hypothetical protein WBN92_00540, partial [Terriglobia bacterium]
YFSLALHLGLPIPDRRQKAYVREQIVSLGLQYPSQFALQADGLNSGRANETYGDRVVIEHSGQVVTGFMMSTSATLRSQHMGAEGDPPLALRKSIDKGMELNKGGHHVNYLEIYEPDVLADEMQPVLRYGASLFERERHSERFQGAGQSVRGEESRSSESQDSETNRPGFKGDRKQHNPEEPGPPRALTNDSVPSGLVVVRHVKNSPQQDRALDEQALKNPFISGVGFQIHWSDIEPVQGKPDWSKLDELFAAAESSKKWVQLCIYPGFFAPAWALGGVKTDLFAVQYGPGKGTVLSLPMPWDSVYLKRWVAFLKQLSDRYGKSPAFRMIAADGPTSVSEEMTLPREVKKWQSDSYTPRKYIEAWQKVFQVYAADFPHQFISLAVGNGLNINDQGKIHPGEGARTRQTIIDQAISLLGRRFSLENHDLHAGPKNQQPETSFVMSYSGRIITGLEMRCAAELGTCSAGMGAEGDPPLALRKSIAKGMELNKVGQHVNYLEIYEPDVLADEMQPVLRYGASLFERKQH